jgi:hypothetical protein
MAEQSTSAVMGAKMDKTMMLCRLLNKHMLGYIHANVYKPEYKITWGEVNDHGMTGMIATNMMKLFIVHGIKSTLIKQMIHIAMSPDWIMGPMLDSPEGLKIMELLVLTLTAGGIEASNTELIEPLEGMGHHGGVLGYCGSVENKITALKSKID